MEKEFYVTGRNNKDCVVLYVCPSTSPFGRGYGGGATEEGDGVRRSQSLGCLDVESGGGAPGCRSKYAEGRNRSRRGGRSLSVCRFGSQMSLLLQDVDDDDLRGFSCSVNNLDTDFVSPRVSTNSLASQTELNYPDVENSEPGGGLFTDDYSSRRLFLLHPDVDPSSFGAAPPLLPPGALYPLRGRPTPSAINASPSSPRLLQQQQNLSPRQGAAVAVGSDGLPVSRSTSCPSVPQQVRRHPLSTLMVTGGDPCMRPRDLDDDDSALLLFRNDDGSSRWNSTNRSRGDLGLQIGSIESDSFNITTPTEESVDRISPHYAEDPSVDFQTEADQLLAAVEKRVVLQTRTAGNGGDGGGGCPPQPEIAADLNARGCMMGSKGTRSDADGYCCQQQQAVVESIVVCDNHKTGGGKVSRNLARSKCLQWLNSLDEGD